MVKGGQAAVVAAVTKKSLQKCKGKQLREKGRGPQEVDEKEGTTVFVLFLTEKWGRGREKKSQITSLKISLYLSFLNVLF